MNVSPLKPFLNATGSLLSVLLIAASAYAGSEDQKQNTLTDRYPQLPATPGADVASAQ